MKSLLTIPLFFLLVFITSCTTPADRISLNQEVFDPFSAEEQARIRKGDIQVGDSRNLVQLAKGSPETVTKRQRQGSEIEVWQWSRSRQASFTHPDHYVGRGAPAPQLVNVSQLQSEDLLRVEFLDGKVIVVEEVREE